MDDRLLRGTEAEGGSAAKTVAPTLSVIVPTKNEEGNVAPLIARFQDVLDPNAAELIFVDDSDDRTEEAINAERATTTFEIQLIHRPPGERRGGLGGAVVEGIRVARGRWISVMDGDLQHPPELIPKLVAAAESSGAAIVIASRYISSDSVDAFGRGRALLSRAAAGAARVVFPLRLRAVSDPMSGFFLVRRNAIDLGVLHPQGFKILVEILARHPHLSVAEVPFVFGTRYRGETKASVREGMVYGLHLVRLRASAFLRKAQPQPTRRAGVRLSGFPRRRVDEESVCES